MLLAQRYGAALAALLGFCLARPAAAAPLEEPPVFAAGPDRVLSLLMVARPRPVTLAGMATTAWTYDVCRRPPGTPDACPPGTGRDPLGGVRLQLNPGDTLRIRLVNHLPVDMQAKHAAENPDLVNNPTNLHTHGLIVEPHRAIGPHDPYGDYVFVEIRNPANHATPPAPTAPAGSSVPAPAGTGAGAHMHGAGGGMVHPDMDVADGAAEYRIVIDKSHPPGLFWFHPHMHGVALNQVSAGLSGIITVGAPAQICADAECRRAVAASTIRSVVLKDEQVEKDGTLLGQEDPGFCLSLPAAGDPPRSGSCIGQVTPDGDHTGGRWFHTVNGQVFPEIAVGPSGDIWRIANASGSRSYDLSLTSDADGTPIPLQVLAIDGVPIDAAGAGAQAMRDLLGGKAEPVACPGTPAGPRAGVRHVEEVCTTHLRLMPSARVELRALRRDGGNAPLHATFRTDHYDTGGDDWPAIGLAAVTLAPAAKQAPAVLMVAGRARAALSAGGVLAAPAQVQVPGAAQPVPVATAAAMPAAPAPAGATAQALRQAPSIAIDPDLALGRRGDPACRRLPAGHRRRILFGNPTPGQDGFGLGYVEVDADGKEIESTRQPIRVFDPATTTVCVPLGPGGRPVEEVWELINLTDEDHNFHIHQTRFRVISGGTTSGTVIPPRLDEALVLHDNLPLPHAADTTGCDGSAEAMEQGRCNPPKVLVRVPFREIGDFVFHCHILEHEDGGMMARIRVVPRPGA